MLAGDSFSLSMFRTLHEAYRKVPVIYRRNSNNLMKEVELIHPDILIIEYVERYMGNLATVNFHIKLNLLYAH